MSIQVASGGSNPIVSDGVSFFLKLYVCLGASWDGADGEYGGSNFFAIALKNDV